MHAIMLEILLFDCKITVTHGSGVHGLQLFVQTSLYIGQRCGKDDACLMSSVLNMFVGPLLVAVLICRS